MTAWFLAFLAVAWIVVYLPSVWRARQKSPFPAVQGFKRRMRLISPRTGNGRWVVVPESREGVARRAYLRAQDRRKRILGGLVAAAFATGVWALISGGNVVELHLIVDALAAFYLALVMDAKRKVVEREQKVRTLHAPAPPVSFDETSEFGYLQAGGGHNS